MNNILEINGLNKRYDTFALQDVSFQVPKGSVTGFIGPNGSGKTTTIKSILNMVHRDSGDIKLFSLDNIKDEIYIKEDIGVVTDLPYYIDKWSIRDVERSIAPFYRMWDHDCFIGLCKKFEISQKKLVKELSRGMGMKLMISIALSHNARFLIMDEPTSGLDPIARDEFVDILSEFMGDKNGINEKGIFFSTHITSDLEKIADRIVFIRNGRIAFAGAKEKLLESYRIVKGKQNDLNRDHKKVMIGYKESESNFTALIHAQDENRLPEKFTFTKASIDEIMVHIYKGDDHIE